MITPDVITDTISEWFRALDYEYMLLHTMISYGIYYSPNMEWVSKKLGGTPYSIWKIGAFLGILEVCRIIPFIDPASADYLPSIVQKFISILHSYILIQVFVEDIVKGVHKWIYLFKRARDNDSLKN
jgi:hypothetical protein